MRRWGAFAGSLVVCFLVVGVAPLLAATPKAGISLQLSPLPIELSTKPGTSAETDLRVRNAGSEPEQLEVRLLKVTDDDNGQVHLTEPQASDDWVHWVSFSRTEFSAPPGQWQTIHMTVAVPKSAAFGYYFAVEYRRASEAQPKPGETAASGAVATFILLNADAPGAVRQAEIVSFTADHRIYEFLPATFTAKIRSTGNVHVAPHGNIFITSGSKQIGAIEVNPTGGNILPHSSRHFSVAWNDGFPHFAAKTDAAGQPLLDQHGQPQTALQWDFSKADRLRFGKYTAHLFLIYSDGTRDIPIEAEVSFWVIPWRLLGAAAALLMLFALLIAYILVLRRRLKRLKARTQEGGV
jgi:hypothetical protein